MSAFQDPPHVFEEERQAILAVLLPLAAFDGFSAMSLKNAAAEAGFEPSTLAAAFPGGVNDVLSLWSAMADQHVRTVLASEAVEGLKIREKVTLGVKARLDYLAPHKETARRAAAYLALPHAAALGTRLTWATADAVWRGLGDTSTDFNFYTKRVILSGVWTSTIMRWFADDEPDMADTLKFLDNRIANVMQFEKLKAQVGKPPFDPADIIGSLAKMRFR